ncbi:microtubule-actin cross-linking factor 1, isoforms 6/7-like [Anoplopoma fimbria]|uniref:microtubule-actin cross-linking factor 1, isoforms 6/7-like n=1 Tax=Anoplopoma fimbria TaxID=229290 RepID=UPI0023ED4C9F|nr:microtubule-actin cross-linking factor 1, isoforms 6/7-like [Anoplopoma fimbria]
MVCGVNLGILLICLVQAEHVCCLLAQQAQRQNSIANVGFLQHGGGFAGSYPQNQLRRSSVSTGSAQSSSLNTDTAVSGGYGQRFPSSGDTQTVSQPDSAYASVRLALRSSVSKPNWLTTNLNQETVQKMPKKQPFRLSTPIASASTASKYAQNPISKTRTWPVQQGSPRTGIDQSSSSESLQSPRETYSFKSASHQAAEQKVPAVAETPAYSGQNGYFRSMKSSSFSSTDAAAPNRIPVRTRTSASAVGRRVPLRRSSVASTPSHFQPHSGKTLSSYTSTEQIPSSTSSLQASWKSRNPTQGAGNLPSSGTSRSETSGQHFAPTTTHNIPQHFGGYAIRRLKEPADQKDGSVKKPQAYVAPQRPSSPKQAYVPPQQAYVAPQRPSSPKQAYVPPSRRTWPLSGRLLRSRRTWPPAGLRGPQRPSSPKQAYVALQRPSSPKQAYVAPQRPSSPKQVYVAPSS